MLVLVTYDVNTETPSGRSRLRKIAKKCVNYGQRVQNSVFECSLDPAQLRLLKADLCSMIDPEKDSIRFYHLGKADKAIVEHFGIKEGYKSNGFLSI